MILAEPEFIIGWLVYVGQLTYCIVGKGSWLLVKAFNVTIIPLPEDKLNVVDPGVELKTPPDNSPVYKLPSNQRKRVMLLYPYPFWEKYKSFVDPLTKI